MNIEDFINTKIMVIGHSNPDTDSITSAYLLTKILKTFNVDAEYAMIEGDSTSQRTKNEISEVMKYNPTIIPKNEISKYKYFLVDHNDAKQSIQNNDLVVGVIDHHPNSNAFKKPIIKQRCATALVIYEIFKEKYTFTKEDKKIIFMAILSDTQCGKSQRYKDNDKILVKELGFDDNLIPYFNRFFIPTDLTDTLDAFKNNRRKVFNFDGDIHFTSTAVEAIDDIKKEEYKLFVKKQKKNFLGIWINYQEETSTIYFKYNGKFLQKDFDHIVSRGMEIIDIILAYIRGNNEN